MKVEVAVSGLPVPNNPYSTGRPEITCELDGVDDNHRDLLWGWGGVGRGGGGEGYGRPEITFEVDGVDDDHGGELVDGAWLQKVPDLVLRLHGHPGVDGTLGTALRVVVKVVKPRKTHHRVSFLFFSIVTKTRSFLYSISTIYFSSISDWRPVYSISVSTSFPSLIGRFYTTF